MPRAYKKPIAPKFTTTEDVAEALGVALPKLTYLIYALKPERRYRTFEIASRSGRKRPISAPIPPLKEIQKTLTELLAPAYVPRVQVQGYVNDRSPLTNADVHKYKRWILHVDIRDFFPSISKRRICGMFRKFPFDYYEDVAGLLAQICTHSGTLPQGAPTSPLLANMICRSLDTRLSTLAVESRCLYSRYCDDITFSTGRKSFPGSLASVDESTGQVAAGEELENAIRSEGFYLRHEKTSLRHRTQRQTVTGLTVNEFVNIPRHYVRSLRNLLFIWKKYGKAAAQASFDQLWQPNRPPGKVSPTLEEIVRGRVQYIGAVKGWFDPVYRRLATSLVDIDPSFSPTDKHSTRPKTLMIIHCEGKSDVKHLFAAWQMFKQQYPQLDLRFTDAGNDTELLKRMESFASVHQTVASIGLFDRDNPSILKKVKGKETSFRRWARGVYSLPLPTPPHREPDEPLCIELMHTDDTLSLVDKDGRRAFRRCEFNENGFHTAGHYVMMKSGGKQLIATEVRDTVSQENVALSKDDFATQIARNRPPFDKVDLSGFQVVFDGIRDIRQQWIIDRLEPF